MRRTVAGGVFKRRLRKTNVKKRKTPQSVTSRRLKRCVVRTLEAGAARSGASGTRAARSRASVRRADMRARRRLRRSETRARRRVIIPWRRGVISRRRLRREVVTRRRRRRRDVNRARIGRVKKGTASEVQRNAEVGGFRLDRNAQRSDRDGADEKRSSERASETAFDGSFHRLYPRKVWKRRSAPLRKSEMENRRKRRDDERSERLALLYASTCRFDALDAEKSPDFFDFARNFSLRRRKLALTNGFRAKIGARSTKKRRRSNRLRFERRRFNVAGRAVGLKC